MCAEPTTKRRRVDSASQKKTGLHVFTRDFRLEDNRSLHTIVQQGVDDLRFCFVFTPEQTEENIKKGYFGEASFAFLVRALKDLEASINRQTGRQLEIYYGRHAEVLAAIHHDTPLHAVSMAEDYTPYAKLRESEVQDKLDSLGVPFSLVEDHCLCPTGLKEIVSGQGTFYKLFTPFYNNASSVKPTPAPLRYEVSELLSIGESYDVPCVHAKAFVFSVEEAARRYITPGIGGDAIKRNVSTATREYALRRLKDYNFNEYSHNRNHLDKASTNLSAHFKYGLVSAREVRHLVINNDKAPSTTREAFIRQLYWRDFYMYITLHNPGVLQKMVKEEENTNFVPNLTGLPWNSEEEDFEKWKRGSTGVPFVDAAIREMNVSGVMHNRGRMVVAMFLTKNLMIDWRRGEQVFAQRLIDYDPCNNNGGWQWSSSTGADGAPYFRVMNPQSQMAKVDPTLAYIKKWVPEIATLPNRDILKWDEKKVHSKYTKMSDFKYCTPMVDVKSTRLAAIDAFKKTIELAKR
eukprot:TRINITY_DN65249_c0_g1_i1.p1 TRINITY_DN65249_c0_g1~~TRINITY_DN65249_c0_g1_i1.p1  ORF type:complete len:519 (+),score=235.98 TRINITY_DN65249_c0_g1_i1:211-1767(+)